MKLFKVLIVLLFVGSPVFLYADSPLTSTPFYKVYSKNEIVREALGAKGKLNKKLMAFLSDKSESIDIKMALINALSWENGNKHNSARFLKYLKKIKRYKSEKILVEKGRGDDLLCYAYLMAMDNYFEVEKSSLLSSIAVGRDSNSFTFNIIAALIQSQTKPYEQWGEIFHLCDEVRENKNLTRDMHEAAVKIIFQYVDVYEKYYRFRI